jgi:uncharacterized membrane protein HdeD (DUF308 family)
MTVHAAPHRADATPLLRAAPVLAAIVGGAASVVVGVLVLAWPAATLRVGAVLFGIQLVTLGVVRVALGTLVAGLEAWVRPIYVVSGLLVAIAGIICLRHPVLSVAVIVVTIAVGWLVDGVALIVAGVSSPRVRWPAVLSGGISLVAAIVLLAYPVSSTAVMLALGGWLLVVIGLISMLGVPWVMREAHRDTAGHA